MMSPEAYCKEGSCNYKAGHVGPHSGTVASMEEQVQALTEMLYAAHSRRFVPRFPWVFVRVISKEQVYKGVIHLPASEQNKVNHEGIVLATWKPFDKRTTVITDLRLEDHIVHYQSE